MNKQPDWKKDKPTEAGMYRTRHADGSNVNVVELIKRGRGFTVFCEAYNDSSPLSEIGKWELEWAKIE